MGDAKYSEAGVAFLKKETTRLSGELSELEQRKISENESFRKDKEEHERQRALMRQALIGFEKMMLEKFAQWEGREMELKQNIATLMTESSFHTKLAALARADLAAVDIGEPDFSFTEQVRDMLVREIEVLDKQKSEKLSENEAIARENERIHRENEELKKEREELEPRLEWLRSEIHLGNDKNGKLGREYLKLEENIASIKHRERQNFLIQRQLAPEYKKVYGGLCSKCKKKIK